VFGFRNKIESSKQREWEVRADFGQAEQCSGGPARGALMKYFVMGAVLFMITVVWVCSIFWEAIQGGVP
jgi:hypothetical protein